MAVRCVVLVFAALSLGSVALRPVDVDQGEDEDLCKDEQDKLKKHALDLFDDLHNFHKLRYKGHPLHQFFLEMRMKGITEKTEPFLKQVAKVTSLKCLTKEFHANLTSELLYPIDDTINFLATDAEELKGLKALSNFRREAYDDSANYTARAWEAFQEAMRTTISSSAALKEEEQEFWKEAIAVLKNPLSRPEGAGPGDAKPLPEEVSSVVGDVDGNQAEIEETQEVIAELQATEAKLDDVNETSLVDVSRHDGSLQAPVLDLSNTPKIMLTMVTVAMATIWWVVLMMTGPVIEEFFFTGIFLFSSNRDLVVGPWYMVTMLYKFVAFIICFFRWLIMKAVDGFKWLFNAIGEKIGEVFGSSAQVDMEKPQANRKAQQAVDEMGKCMAYFSRWYEENDSIGRFYHFGQFLELGKTELAAVMLANATGAAALASAHLAIGQ